MSIGKSPRLLMSPTLLSHYLVGFIISLGKSVLNLIPAQTIIPIVTGKSKDLKWIRGSGCHSYWLGTYELRKNILFGKTVKPKHVVYDIGAHVGFYTLLASKLVGKSGHVYAFEPNPKNLSFLKQHLSLNKVANTTIFPVALSNQTGPANFSLAQSDLMGRLDKQGKTKVKTTTLDNLLKRKLLKPPNILKIDAEGAEYSILQGASFLLSHYHPDIFLATHDRYYLPKTHQLCCRVLQQAGYSLKPLGASNLSSAEEIYAFYHPKN